MNTNAERIEMSGLLANAPDNGCEHTLAYEVADDRVMCYGCGASWDLVKPEAPAAPAATKAKKGRGKKTDTAVGTQEAELPQPDDDDTVLGADVQDDGEGDAQLQPIADIPVPDAPTASTDVPKAGRRGKKAKPPEPADEESPAYSDEGPWNGMKCPSKTCVSKLDIVYPNIYANKGATYHYECKNCEARVTVNFPEGI
jgi:hypothetical protein